MLSMALGTAHQKFGLAFGIDPWMPLEGWRRGVIQYKLSHLLFTLPETICSNLRGTFETPMAPFQLECALCVPLHKCPVLKHPVPQVPCLLSLRYSHELQESWRIAACLPKLSSTIPQRGGSKREELAAPVG